MNYSNFRNWLMAEIITELKRLGLEAEVEFFDVEKYDESYPGISVRFLDKVSGPVLNLEKLYALYEEKQDPTYIKNNVMRIILEQGLDNKAVSGLTDYEQIKDRLYIQVCGAEENREMLKGLPHRIVADLAITYHVLVQTTSEGLASAAVTNDLLRVYGVSPEKLDRDALAASAGNLRPVFNSVEAFVLSPYLAPEQVPSPGNGIMAVSNEYRTYGAAAIFYPGMMERVAGYFGGDFVMIPSSVNEVIVLPAEGADMKLMKDMVTAVNSLIVSDSEVLTNSVYHYDAREKVFETSEQYEKRLIRDPGPGREPAPDIPFDRDPPSPSRDEGPER